MWLDRMKLKCQDIITVLQRNILRRGDLGTPEWIYHLRVCT